MKRTLLFLIGCFLCLLSFSQNRNNIWYFGDSTGIDFNTNPPSILSNSSMYSHEASATICNNNGNLLFYTNGDMVWNRNHAMMPYGFGLDGGMYSSATQGTIIIPKPCNNNLYYIFTVTEQEQNPNFFSYSIVDMTLDGGLGEVTVKNFTIHGSVTERLTATLQANGIDYWVVAQERITGNLLVYSLTATGLSITPIIYNSGGIDALDILGYMRFSHGGTKLCITNNNQLGKAVLYDFDRITGTVSNPINLTGVFPYGIEFSPDDSKLYISSHVTSKLYQYDLSAGSPTAIQNSQTIVTGVLAIYGALKMAPDGKIYINRFDENYLGIIDQPNQAGVACNVIINGISLSPGRARLGLPNNIDVFSACNPCPPAVNTTMNVTVCSNQNYQLPSGITVSDEGIYLDTIRSQASCDSIIYTVNLSLYNVSLINTEAHICSNEAYQLPLGMIVNVEGVYNDTIKNQASCDSIIYTIEVFVNDVTTLNQVDSVYPGQNYTLPSGVIVNSAGSYQSIFTNSLGCDSIITTVLKFKTAFAECVSLKNAFTPNGDGVNDLWILYRYNCFKKLMVSVYNRYGTAVYHADDYKNDWNGKYKNTKLPDGTYYYIIELTLFNGIKNTLKGNVTILR